MLTAREADSDEADSLDSGADDYLRKPFSFQVLVARCRALVRRGGREGWAELIAGDLVLEPARREVRLAGASPVHLSRREAALLEYLMRTRRRRAVQGRDPRERLGRRGGSAGEPGRGVRRVPAQEARPAFGDPPAPHPAWAGLPAGGPDRERAGPPCADSCRCGHAWCWARALVAVVVAAHSAARRLGHPRGADRRRRRGGRGAGGAGRGPGAVAASCRARSPKPTSSRPLSRSSAGTRCSAPRRTRPPRTSSACSPSSRPVSDHVIHVGPPADRRRRPVPRDGAGNSDAAGERHRLRGRRRRGRRRVRWRRWLSKGAVGLTVLLAVFACRSVARGRPDA